ncbi:MAG: InlB B-repeat-containing protein [Treponema sp.]|nr:InlB B-repeat-containing protein [Treponema sp.]
MKNLKNKLVPFLLYAAVILTASCSNPILEKWWTDKSTASVKDYHVVGFSMDGGGPFIQPIMIIHEGKVPGTPVVTKTGHAFGGWFTNIARTGLQWDFDNDVVLQDTTLYAKWVPISYEIKFGANGGTPAPDPQYVLYNTTIAEPLPMTNSIKGFAGWYTEDGTGTALGSVTGQWGDQWNFATPVEKSMSLYAKWDDTAHTVSFIDGGGTPAPDPQYIAHGGKVAEPAEMTLTDYDFGGWYDSTTNLIYDFSQPVETDMTLYAKWSPKPVSVTFMNDRAADIDRDVPRAQALLKGTPAAEPSPILCAGYAFGGWYMTPKGTPIDWSVLWDFAAPVNEDIELHAMWIPKPYTVKFEANGGKYSDSTTPPDQIILNGTMVREPPIAMTNGTMVFGGWFTDKACTKVWNFNTPVNSDMTLYALWSTKYYTITFYANMGTLAPDPQKVAHGGTILEPRQMTLTNYGFGGWYTNGISYNPITQGYNPATEFTNEWDFNTVVTKDMSLYARWDINYCHAAFDTNGGTPAVADQTVAMGGLLAAPRPVTKNGYAFAGWYDTPAYSGQAWNFSQGTVTTDLTLYAKWVPNVYTITFNTNGGMPLPDPLHQLAAYGEKVQEPLPMYNAGKGFGGWWTEDGTGKTAGSSPDVWGALWLFNASTVNGDQTLYAKWVDNVYSVTYEPKGGTPAPNPLTQYFEQDSLLTRPESMTKTGYDFAGWFTEPNPDLSGSNPAEPWKFSADTINAGNVDAGGNLKLYAWWEPALYTVTFVPYQGTPAPASKKVLYNTAVPRPAPMTRPDENQHSYAFKGWYSNPGFTGSEWNFDTDKVLADTVLYANWEEVPFVYTVIFTGNGGITPGVQQVIAGTRVLEPPNMIKPSDMGGDYGFGGWYTKDQAGGVWDESALWNFAIPVDDSNTDNRVLNLYARYDTIRSRVFFQANEGTPAPQDQWIARGTRVNEPLAMTKANNSFGGWYANDRFEGLPWNFAAGKVTTDELTLYARWIPNDIPPTEIIQRVRIHGVYYVNFAGNSITYNGPPVWPGTTSLKPLEIDGNNSSIKSVCDIMNAHPDFIVQLSGHANPIDNTDEELAQLIEISTARSDAVSKILQGRGVNVASIINAGYNDRLYGDGAQGSLNRTVEIIIVEYLPLK